MLIRPVYRPRMPSLALGLIGWWPMFGSNVIDQSGNGNLGTSAGHAPTPITGPNAALPALKFTSTSSQYIDLGRMSSLEGAAQTTFALWFRRGGGTNVITLGKADTAAQLNSAGDIQIYSDGNIYLNVGAATATNFGKFASNDSLWHHLAMIYDGTQTGNANRLKAYLDGVAKTITFTGTIPATLASVTQNLYFGRDHEGTSGFIYSDGSYADFRIYNRPLAPAEVIALYAEAFQPQIDIGTIALMQKSQQSFLAAWAMQRNQINQGWAS